MQRKEYSNSLSHTFLQAGYMYTYTMTGFDMIVCIGWW